MGFSLVINGCLAVLSYLSAPVVAACFGNPAVEPLVQALSFLFVAAGFRVITINLLSKDLRMDKRSKAEVLSAVFGLLAALTLAFLGYGVWALVANALVSSVIINIMLYLYCPIKPVPSLRFREAREMISFGMMMMVSNLQWYVYSNADTLIVGKLLGEKALGFYGMAFKLATMPTEKFTTVINTVTMPAFAKLQGDKERMGWFLLKLTRSVSIVTFPVCVGLFVLAEEIIHVVLTDKWLPMLVPLRALGLVGMLKSVDVIVPHMLKANGKASLLLRYNFLLLMVLPAAFGVGALWGIEGVGYAWLIAYPALFLVLLAMSLGVVGLRMRDYFISMCPALAGSLLMGGALHLGKAVLGPSLDPATALGLTSFVAGGAGVYAAYLLLFQSALLREGIGMVVPSGRRAAGGGMPGAPAETAEPLPSPVMHPGDAA
jgi:O-antigen/teichoic acid export membrane protein